MISDCNRWNPWAGSSMPPDVQGVPKIHVKRFFQSIRPIKGTGRACQCSARTGGFLHKAAPRSLSRPPTGGARRPLQAPQRRRPPRAPQRRARGARGPPSPTRGGVHVYDTYLFIPLYVYAYTCIWLILSRSQQSAEHVFDSFSLSTALVNEI